jgi:hypothetical protein
MSKNIPINRPTIFIDESLIQSPQKAVEMAVAVRVLESRRMVLDHDLSLIETDQQPQVNSLETNLDGLALRVNLAYDLAHQSAMEQRLLLEKVKSKL